MARQAAVTPLLDQRTTRQVQGHGMVLQVDDLGDHRQMGPDSAVKIAVAGRYQQLGLGVRQRPYPFGRMVGQVAGRDRHANIIGSKAAS